MFNILNSTWTTIRGLELYFNSSYTAFTKITKKGKEKHKPGYAASILFSAVYNEIFDPSKEEHKKLQEIVDQYYDYSFRENDDGTKELLFNAKDNKIEKDIEKEKLLYAGYSDMTNIHCQNTLIMLLVRYEQFIRRLLSKLFMMFPDKYLNGHSIKLEDINNCNNIIEIKYKVTNHEIERIMYESNKEWIKILQSHKLVNNTINDILNELDEIYARRNIIVHNSSIVNEIYLKTSGNTKASLGQKLQVDKKYIQHAFFVIKCIIITTMIECHKLVNEESKEDYLNVISSRYLYDLLKDENYDLCIISYQQLLKNKYMTKETKELIQINLWIAMEQKQGIESIEKSVVEYNPQTEIFSLAKDVLLHNWDMVVNRLSVLFPEKIHPSYIEEWPLFIEFRNTSQYTAFKDENAEKFDVYLLEDDDVNEQNDIE